LAIALVPIFTMFIAFTVIYVLRRNFAQNPDDNLLARPQWISINLPVGLLLMNSFLLLVSSLTVELARRQIKRRAVLAPVATIPGVSLGNESYFPWLGVTIVLGLTFLAGQWMAWRELAARGFYLATSPSSSLFYVLTAAHGLHLAGGLTVLLYAAVVAARRQSIEVRRIVVDVTALYWHFMLLLWIYIFALVWIAR
jgi:cytochrome c oxidase subunit 3